MRTHILPAAAALIAFAFLILLLIPVTPPTPSHTLQPPTCTTDTECVLLNPHTIPDANTIRAYLATYPTPRFPTIGDCSKVDWTALDDDGLPFLPVDLDHDGAINCNSDFELGA